MSIAQMEHRIEQNDLESRDAHADSASVAADHSTDRQDSPSRIEPSNRKWWDFFRMGQA